MHARVCVGLAQVYARGRIFQCREMCVRRPHRKLDLHRTLKGKSESRYKVLTVSKNAYQLFAPETNRKSSRHLISKNVITSLYKISAVIDSANTITGTKLTNTRKDKSAAYHLPYL